jgi:hypothetical protein
MGNRDSVYRRGVEEVVRKFGGYGDWFTYSAGEVLLFIMIHPFLS